jgi:hypothetical protein
VQKEEAEYSSGGDGAYSYGSGSEAGRTGEPAGDYDYNAPGDGSGDGWNRDDDSSCYDKAETEA